MSSLQLPSGLRSLRAKMLLSLVLVSSTVASIGVWRVTSVYAWRLEQQLRDRAKTLTDSITYLAATVDHAPQLQRFVAGVSARSGVHSVLVVSRDEGRVVASSDPRLLGLPLEKLPVDLRSRLAATSDTAAEQGVLRQPLHLYDWFAPAMIASRDIPQAPLSRGAVLVRIDTNESETELQLALHRVAFMLFTLVGVTTVITYWMLHRWVLVPARDVVNALMDRAAGNRLSYAPVHSDDELGKVSTSLNMMLDTLDRKEAERQRALASLSASEALARKLSMVASRTDNSVVITDAEGRIDWVNDGFTRISGYTLAEVHGKKPGDVLQGPETNPATVQFMRQRLDQRQGFSVELVNYHKSGYPYWVSIEVQPILDDNGKLTHFMAIQRDITARRDAQAEQQKFVSLVENSNDFIGMTSLEGQFTYVNPAGCQLVGLSGLAHAIRQNLVDLAFEDSASFLANKVLPEALESGQWTGELEFRHLPTNQRIDVQTTLFVIRDQQSGKAICLAIVARDVTERKRAEARLLRSHQEIAAARVLLEQQTRALQTQNEELQLARERAEAAAQAKSAFLANMSHEIRTPMTAILGFADILYNSVKLPEEIDAVDTIRRNGEHLLSIINDILDLSKVEANRMAVESIPFDPMQVMADVLGLMRVRLTSKGLSCEMKVQGELPEQIVSDPTRWRQILINLIGNAVKFTERGGITVTLELDESNAERPLLCVDVTDTGIGLTEEQIGNLFQPFMQADNSMTRRFGGTGLGLTISKRFAEMLGGDITVTSRPGEGSTFRVTIATGDLTGVRRVRSFAKPALSPSPAPAPTRGKEFEGRRILLAEDGPDNQRIISYLLTKAGATVAVVENGLLAVEAAREALKRGESFDAVLLDMQMPVMDGYQAAGELRKVGYQGPIIALTAHAMQGDREKCLAAGCDSYATKPIDRRVLFDVLKQQLERCGSVAADHS